MRMKSLLSLALLTTGFSSLLVVLLMTGGNPAVLTIFFACT
jgi:hypothetical protein